MQVRALRKCFIDNAIRDEGSVFDYTGPRNTNLEPLNGATWNDVQTEVAPEMIEPMGRRGGRRKHNRDQMIDEAEMNAAK